MKSKSAISTPIHLWKFGGSLILLFAIVIILTMWKDFWLSSEKPNVWFYILVPTSSIIGGLLSMYGIAKISHQLITFSSMFIINLSVNIIMQIFENIAKISYFYLWKYSGLLYILLLLSLSFLLMIYGLIRWGKVKVWMAAILTTADFIGSMIVSVILTNVIEISTPGS